MRLCVISLYTRAIQFRTKPATTSTDWKNRLYFGDNLDILRNHVPDASVDLIYLDPPFNSNSTYNVLFNEVTGQKSAAQITAFEDTWHWSLESDLRQDRKCEVATAVCSAR